MESKTCKYAVTIMYARYPETVKYEVEAESVDAAEREAMRDFDRDAQFWGFNGIVQAGWITDITEDEDDNGENADTSEDA